MLGPVPELPRPAAPRAVPGAAPAYRANRKSRPPQTPRPRHPIRAKGCVARFPRGESSLSRCNSMRCSPRLQSSPDRRKRRRRALSRRGAMPQIRSLCVYCGSSGAVDEKYRAAATELGEALAAAGIQLVYGGGRVGLMGLLADAVLAGGGWVVGIIPE